MSAPNLYTLSGLMKAADGTNQTILPDGRRVPVRPLGFYSVWSRIRLAWLVFTGRADAVVWPGEEAAAGILPQTEKGS